MIEIIDTDGGFDDLMAIFYAIRIGIKISAITTTFGNTTAIKAGENVADFLNFLNLKIPIYIGETPEYFIEDKDFAGDRGLFDISLPKSQRNFQDISPADFYNEIKEPFQIISLAPATNLAKIKNKNLKKIKMSSGYFNLKDVKEKRMAWNARLDPESYKILYNSGIEILVTGLDATGDYACDLNKLRGHISEIGILMDKALNFTKKRSCRDFTAISDVTVFAEKLKSVKGIVKFSGHNDYTFSSLIPDKKGKIEVATSISPDFISILAHLL